MQLEVGSVLEGKVSGITTFGAFVDLEDGKTGMVHISEISTTFVKEISDHLKVGDAVKVKVIEFTPNGKISLSIKQALPPPPKPAQREFHNQRPKSAGGRGNFSPRPPKVVQSPFERREASANEDLSFEDMMSRFKQTSDDKMSDLKRVTDAKRGTSRGRRGKP